MKRKTVYILITTMLCLTSIAMSACTKKDQSESIVPTTTVESNVAEITTPIVVTDKNNTVENNTPIVIKEYQISEDVSNELEKYKDAVFPYTEPMAKAFGWTMVYELGEYDGIFDGLIRPKSSNTVELDLYEYVFYKKDEIESLKYGDIIIIENTPMTVDSVAFEFPDAEKKGNATVVFNENTPYGEIALHLMPFTDTVNYFNEDYCVDTNKDILAHQIYTKTIEISLADTIDISDDDNNTVSYSAADFVSLLYTDERFKDKDVQITIYDGLLRFVHPWTNPVLERNVESETSNEEQIEPTISVDNDGVVRPYYLLTEQEMTSGSKSTSVNNYYTTVESIDGEKATLNIYKTDFYKKSDLESLLNGGTIVLNDKEIEVIGEFPLDDAIMVAETNQKRYEFRRYYTRLLDYCLMNGSRPAMTFHETIEAKISPSAECVIIKNTDQEYRKQATVDEVIDYLKANPNLNKPENVSVMVMNNTILGIVVADYVK